MAVEGGGQRESRLPAPSDSFVGSEELHRAGKTAHASSQRLTRNTEKWEQSILLGWCNSRRLYLPFLFLLVLQFHLCNTQIKKFFQNTADSWEHHRSHTHPFCLISRLGFQRQGFHLLFQKRAKNKNTKQTRKAETKKELSLRDHQPDPWLPTEMAQFRAWDPECAQEQATLEVGKHSCEGITSHLPISSSPKLEVIKGGGRSSSYGVVERAQGLGMWGETLVLPLISHMTFNQFLKPGWASVFLSLKWL